MGLINLYSFYVNDQLVWGTDRLFFVERYLGRTSAEPERLMSPPYQVNYTITLMIAASHYYYYYYYYYY